MMVSKSYLSEVVSLDLNGLMKNSNKTLLACDDDQEKDVDKDTSPGKSFGVQERNLDDTITMTEKPWRLA